MAVFLIALLAGVSAAGILRSQNVAAQQSAGFERAAAKQLGSNIRYFPSRISGVRGDGINIADLSLFKTFTLLERVKLQLRGEAEGVANHPNFDVPNMTPNNSLFGVISTTQTNQEERRIFVGLKLMF